jgi:hypothetical protein
VERDIAAVIERELEKGMAEAAAGPDPSSGGGVNTGSGALAHQGEASSSGSSNGPSSSVDAGAKSGAGAGTGAGASAAGTVAGAGPSSKGGGDGGSAAGKAQTKQQTEDARLHQVTVAALKEYRAVWVSGGCHRAGPKWGTLACAQCSGELGDATRSTTCGAGCLGMRPVCWPWLPLDAGSVIIMVMQI